MKTSAAVALVVAFVGLGGAMGCLGFGLMGCRAAQRAAANDPQRCERDPKCNGHQDKSRDCITACSDDIACIDRCRQVTGQR